jgi:hypothetical protein
LALVGKGCPDTSTTPQRRRLSPSGGCGMSETPFDDASLIDLEPVLGGCDSAKERRLRNLAKKLGFALVKPWAGERRGLAERQHRSRSDVIRQAALRQLETAGLCPVAIEG